MTKRSSSRYRLRDFLRWAHGRRLCRHLVVPARAPRTRRATLPADQQWALLRRCLTDAQLSTPLRVAGSLVLLYGQTPTRIVTFTQHDVTHLDGMTYIALHRQPVLMPTRFADLVGQLGESSTARQRPLGSGRAGSPWLFPGAYPGAHKEPDISARRSMNSSDWRFVPAAAPRCATLPTNCRPRCWPHYSASQSTPPAGGPH